MLLTLILLPFLGALAAACLPSNARNREAWFSGILAATGTLIAIALYPDIAAGEVIRYERSWLPAHGLAFSLRMDGLAWLFVVLINGIGVLISLYARYYMSPKDPVPRFFLFLLAFMGSMVGIVLSGNLVQLVVFWELTSLTSFLLIGYWHHHIDARRGARMAFTVTAGGGLCLLVGVLMVGHIVGSYDLGVVLASGDLIRDHPWYHAVLVLIALGALTKSAQFPFHFWLPHAMTAPTPVSAYLHSATMVKAGIFLLMRLSPILDGTPEWTWIIGGAGVTTLVLGSFIAIFQHDLKGLLAYSTISHLGLITVLLGMSTPLAMVAAIFHVLNHATFKASLFMAAGIIDHETGTRDMRALKGLYGSMPITGTLAIVAAAAMAGVPLLNGFLSKELFFAETLLAGGERNWWLPIAAVAMGIFSVTYSLRFISVFFRGKAGDLPRQPREAPRWMRFPIELLVLLCLAVGIAPSLSVGPFLRVAAESVLGPAMPEFSLVVWHGFSLPVLMSIIALSGGVLFYTALRRYYNLAARDRTPVLHRFRGAQAYETAMLRLYRAAALLIAWCGTTRLQPQLAAMITGMIVLPLLLVGALGGEHLPGGEAKIPLDPFLGPLWLIGCVCALGAAWTAGSNRLVSLILSGGTGVVVTMTFLWLSAPDLALTQLMVETVTVVLILLGLRWLPPRSREHGQPVSLRGRVMRVRDGLIAGAAGLSLAVATYAVLVLPADGALSRYFLEQALPGGGGTNVVNVILVDFRSFDTWGEITVLAVVALTVYALLRRFRPAPDSVALVQQQPGDVDRAARETPAEQALGGYLWIPGVYLRFLLPFMGLVTAYYFMRGHNLPGGGFVAGLILAVAILVQYMLAGTTWVEKHLRLAPNRWIGAGLVLGGLTGVGAWVFGHPFLTTHTATMTLPLLGELHLPSAVLFDLGVLMVVVGSTFLILVALGHQAIRGPRVADPGRAEPASSRRGIG